MKKMNEDSGSSQHPVYFVEQLMWIAAGPIVSRLSFGISTAQDGEDPEQVVTLVFPTPAIYDFIQHLVNGFHDPEFKTRASAMIDAYGRKLRHTAAPISPERTEEVSPEPHLETPDAGPK